MFLYTADYLLARLSLPGGLCAWLAEWLTQFYYYPTLGAVILGALSLVIYVSTFSLLRSHRCQAVYAAVLSAILPCALLCVMGNEHVMLCYVVSLGVVLAVSALCLKFLGSSYSAASTVLAAPRVRIVVILLVLASLQVSLYYLAGPVALTFGLLTLAAAWRCPRRGLAITLVLIVLAVSMAACLVFTYCCVTPHYPWPVILNGIFYFRAIRFDLEAPTVLLLLPLLVPVLVSGASLIPPVSSPRTRMLLAITACVLLSVSTVCGIRQCYDADKYVQLRQVFLIRGERWQQLLDEARSGQPHTPMSCTAVNLALAMTHQLPQRQFEYYQCGIEGLLLRHQPDHVQNLPTMEAYYRLGLINLAQWYAFELQQAIPNQNQSARLTQRLAECNLINGRYEVASKYIDLLSQTRFYRHWAEQAKQLLWNDDLLSLHTEYGRLRRWLPSQEDDCTFPHPEVEIIIGRQYVRDNSNVMAMQYFLSSLLLKGQAEQFVSYLVPEQRSNPFPRGYRAYYERISREQSASPYDAVTGSTLQLRIDN